MSDHEPNLADNFERIWLGPLCQVDERCWSQDPQPCDECELPAIEYIRADVAASALAAQREQWMAALNPAPAMSKEVMPNVRPPIGQALNATPPQPAPSPAGAIERDYKIPCDVMLPPNTIVRRGCSLGALLAGMRGREQGYDAQGIVSFDRAAPVTEEIERFVRWVINEGPFAGNDLDGGSIQEMAVKCGLLVETQYDPAIHGENDCDAEKGDPWFVFTAALAPGGGT